MIEKVYNKIIQNKKNTLIFITILTLISSIPTVFFPGVRSGHDTYFHLSRICAIADNIKEMNFFKGVYSGYLNGYGYASGLFYPDIFLYIPALLTVIGIKVTTSYKIFLVLINFLSILSIYITIKGISKNNYASILGSIIYAFVSYRLVDMYQRSALGETLAFIFTPLIVYGIYEIIFEDKKKFYILTIGMSGLILSHVVSTYIIGIFLFIFCTINIKQLLKEKRIIYLIIAAIITLLLTSYFTIPMIEQMLSQTFYYSEISNISDFQLYKRTVPIYLMILEIPSLRTVVYDKYWVPSGIGIIFIYMIYKKIKYKQIKDRFINQSFIISVVALILITFTPIWKINIMKKVFYMIQFPWRILIIPTLLLTISGSILLSKIGESKKVLKNTFFISLISLMSMVCFSAMPNRIKEIEEYSLAYAEYLPIDVNREYVNNRGQIITSNNKIKTNFEKTGTTMNISFKQNSKDTYLELPLVYYKGYKASINKINLETFKTENALLGIRINDIKEGTINVQYRGTKIANITKIISLISFIIFISYVTKEAKHKNEK